MFNPVSFLKSRFRPAPARAVVPAATPANDVTTDEYLAAVSAVIAARLAVRTASVVNFDAAIRRYQEAARHRAHLDSRIIWLDEADEAEAA